MAIVLNKLKIINDPVYGFVKVTYPFLFDIIEHKYFQRLRGIKQLGLTSLVYPGAMHNRFQHAIGAMHLMSLAVQSLREKGVKVTDQESEAVHIAILLHDIGHGPFSHALENSIVEDISHEEISLMFMNVLNKYYSGKLNTAIDIYKNQHPKQFLHQLVSSQLDMDRLDYLRRDSFFSGVTEGVVGSDRIIKMLNVHNDNLVVESKGLFSIEKFLIARRLMYWQVYLHKTVLVAENMLVHVLKRAKFLTEKGELLFCTPALHFFLSNKISLKHFSDPAVLDNFAALDDADIMSAIKVWSRHSDFILATLASALINRDLFRIEIQNEPFIDNFIEKKKAEISILYPNCLLKDIGELVLVGRIQNNTYSKDINSIRILFSDNTVSEITEVSDVLNDTFIRKNVSKYFICYPKF